MRCERRRKSSLRDKGLCGEMGMWGSSAIRLLEAALGRSREGAAGSTRRRRTEWIQCRPRRVVQRSPSRGDKGRSGEQWRKETAYVLQVQGYWDMVCALVVHGVLSEGLVYDAGQEMYFQCSKIQPT